MGRGISGFIVPKMDSDALAEKIRELTEQGLAAAVYTQLTDVEEESNGILTYDRKVCKWEPQEAKDFCPKE